MMIPLLRDWDFDAVMTHNRFTLVNRNAEPLLDLATAKGIAVMNAAPYASGVLAKGSVAYPHYAYQEADDAALAPIRRIEAIAARYRIPLGAAALQFSLRDRARHLDGVRRHQAGAGEGDPGLGALPDPRGVLAGGREPSVRHRRPGGDAHPPEGVSNTAPSAKPAANEGRRARRALAARASAKETEEGRMALPRSRECSQS